jgi:hypothetical protein
MFVQALVLLTFLVKETALVFMNRFLLVEEEAHLYLICEICLDLTKRESLHKTKPS